MTLKSSCSQTASLLLASLPLSLSLSLSVATARSEFAAARCRLSAPLLERGASEARRKESREGLAAWLFPHLPSCPSCFLAVALPLNRCDWLPCSHLQHLCNADTCFPVSRLALAHRLLFVLNSLTWLEQFEPDGYCRQSPLSCDQDQQKCRANTNKVGIWAGFGPE